MGTNTAKKKESVRRILDAAAKIFAEAGYGGARVDEIAACAGVNKAMIYYHIGDKKALYARVLHDVFGDTADRLATSIKTAGTPVEKIQAYVRSLARTFDRHPHLPPIMMREVASGGLNFPEIVAGDLAAIINLLTKVLQEGKERGDFTDINPLVIHLMVVGGFSFLKTSKPLRTRFSPLAETVNATPDDDPAYLVGEIEKLVLRAIRK